MSNTLLRELFRSLEASIHERLVVLEELIQNTEAPSGAIEESLQITRMDPALQDRLSTIDTTLRELFSLQKTIGDAVKQNKRDNENTFVTFNDCVKETDCRLQEVIQELTDMKEAMGSLIARVESLEAKPSAAKVEEVEAEVAEAEEHVIEEEEELVEEEVEEEADDEAEEEEGGLEGEEFTYKGKTFFRSTDNKVYLPDEDGAVDPDAPYGLWVPNPKLAEGGKITRLPN